MDTSEIYIKMCDCDEVQRGWEPDWGDWYKDGQNGDVQCVAIDDEEDVADDLERCGHKYCPMWLPRQDQIQEELDKKKYNAAYVLLQRINQWMTETADKTLISQDTHYSMEQLWLMFYMNENHNKIWNGKEWIKQ